MNKTRQQQLTDCNSDDLTDEEWRQGWHFCLERNGQLRNSNEDDFQCSCTPYQNKFLTRLKRAVRAFIDK